MGKIVYSVGGVKPNDNPSNEKLEPCDKTCTGCYCQCEARSGTFENGQCCSDCAKLVWEALNPTNTNTEEE